MNLRPILFADFDGVLNHEGWTRRRIASRNMNPTDADLIDPSCVARLQRICDRTGAAIVISSAWRALVGRTRSTAALRHHGLTADVLGGTPIIEGTYHGAAVMTASGRAQEIHAWLYVNALIDRWAVLDDNHVDVDPARFVRTNPAIGITDADVERAIAILTRAR